MRINHNIPALNAHRQLNRNSNISAGVLERLSSGKRINRAADDAAGMAISEKMKAQVRGLTKAAQNTLDGISLIQTAEGAMNEVHSMLQRMRELAVQSANGTVTNEDRKAIQDEINQLTSEVNRIANGTEFNTRNILRGNEAPNSNTTVHRMSTGESATLVGAPQFATDAAVKGLGDLTSQQLSIWIDGKERVVNLSKLDGKLPTDTPAGNATIDNLLECINSALGDLGQAVLNNDHKIEIKSNSIGGSSEVKITGTSVGTDNILKQVFGTNNLDDLKESGASEKDTGNAKGSFYFSELPEVGSTLTIGNEKIEFYNSSLEPYTGSNRPIDLNAIATTEKLVETLASLGIEGVKLSIDGIIPPNPIPPGKVPARLQVEAVESGFKGQAIFIEGTPKEFVANLQIGPNQGQGFRLSIGDVRASKLGISSSTPDGNTGVTGAAFRSIIEVTNGLSAGAIEYALDVSTEERATAAITVYNDAILKVAEMRGSLGAIQNRLEHTTANLENTTENLTAALSRIEDADMALEMSEFTKYNILIQAGTAMLAQANQRPQTILQLL